MTRVFLLFALLCGLPLSAKAQQDIASASSKDPLEITADESLEWKRNDKLFVARKNAIARQGDSAINAQLLTAHYREGKQGSGMEIWQVEGENDVVIHTKDSEAHGDKLDYDLDKGLAVMTGSDLKMISPDQVVTAKDRFEYWVTDGRLNAVGGAKVVRRNNKGGTDILESDKVSAVMKDNSQGQRELYSLEALGNVVITTATEVVTGAYGIYRADTNKAELTGNVTIKRGPNVLEGEKAEVDLNTETSRIFGNSSGDGRVRGIFYPGSEKKPDAAP